MKNLRARVDLLRIFNLRPRMLVRSMIVGLFMTTSAYADTAARALTDLVYEIGEARLQLASHVLRSSADFWSENANVSPATGHLSLKQILGESQNFRSILALDENGILLFDSYNQTPIGSVGGKPLDLSSRAYFKTVTNMPSKELHLHEPNVGKQSGEAFIPLSMSVPNETGFRQKVVMLTMPPKTLLPPVEVCNYCGIVLVHDNKVLASNHPLSEVNKAVISRLSLEGVYGASDFEIRGMEVNVHWRRSERFGVIYIYYEASPDFQF